MTVSKYHGDFTVGVTSDGTKLVIGSEDNGISTSLIMPETSVVKLIQLLAATLENFDVSVTHRD